MSDLEKTAVKDPQQEEKTEDFKPEERQSLQTWERAVQEIQGTPQERINRASTPASEAGVKYYDAEGRPLKQLDNLDKDKPLLSVTRDRSGREVVSVFKDKEAAAEGKPILQQAFTYKTSGDKTTEHREIKVPGQPETQISTTFDSGNYKLQFDVEKNGDKQTIVLDGSSNVSQFDLSKQGLSLRYEIENEKIVGVKAFNKDDSEVPLAEKDKEQFIQTAEKDLKTLRSRNGIPEPINVDRDSHAQDERNRINSWTGDAGRSQIPSSNDQTPLEREVSQRNAAIWRDKLSKEIKGKDYNVNDAESWRRDYNQENVRALEKVFGGEPLDEILGRHGMGDKPGGIAELSDQERNAFYLREYLRAQSDEKRKAALSGLEDEALGGNNHYAGDMLKTLALADASRKLDSAKTDSEKREALKELAGIEFSDEESKKHRDTLLNAFPSDQVEQVKTEVALQKQAQKLETQVALAKALTLDGAERKEALAELEKNCRKSLLSETNDNISDLGKAIQKAKTADAVKNLSEATTPEKMEEAYKQLHELALSGNKDAKDIVEKNQQQITSAKNELSSGDYDSRQRGFETMQQAFSEAISVAKDYKKLSATELLYQNAKPEEVEKAREEIAEFANQNFQRADKYLETYLDRSSSADQRKEALKGLEQESAQRMSVIRSDNFAPVVNTLKAAEQVRNFHSSLESAANKLADKNLGEEERKQAVNQVKQEFAEMIAQNSDTTRGNPELDRFLSKFKNEEFGKLLKDLDNPDKQSHVIDKLRAEIPGPDTALNELRVGRILHGIDGNSSAGDYSDMVEKLKKESTEFDNKIAQDWLKWAEPAEQLALLKEASSPEQVSDAVSKLSSMAPDNAHARRALAAFLMSDANAESKLDWRRRGFGSIDGKPTFIPDLQDLEMRFTKEFQETKLQAIKALSESSGEGKADLSIGETTALAIAAISHAGKQPNYDVDRTALTNAATELLQRTIADKTTDEKTQFRYHSPASKNAMQSLQHVLTTDLPGRELLNDTYLSSKSATHPDFQYGLAEFAKKAYAEDSNSMYILAATTSGITGDGRQTNEAVQALERAGIDNRNRATVSAEILSAYSKFGDNAKLLSTLGSMAERDQKISQEMREAFKSGIESTSNRTHQSAVDGLMKAAEFWTKDDLAIVQENLSPAMIAGLAENADKIPEDLRNELIKTCIDRANPAREIPGSPKGDLAQRTEHFAKTENYTKREEDFAQRASAIKTIGALGRYATHDQLMIIGKMGDAEGQDIKNPKWADAGGKNAVEKLGFTDEQAKALQTEAGKAVLQIMGKSENPDTKAAAYDAFKLLRWDGVGPKNIRDAVVEYVQGRGNLSLDQHDEVAKLVYDANIPMPAAAVLRNLVPAERRNERTDAEYYQRAEEIAKFYATKDRSGEAFIRDISTRAAMWNSLEQWQRREITGSSADLESGKSIGISPENMDHRIFNALPPAIRKELTGSEKSISPDKALPDLSYKELSAASFNKLSPELRKQLTGSNEDIDLLRLHEVLNNKEVQNRFPFLTANGVNGQSLEQAVKQQQSDAAKQVADLEQRVDDANRQKSDVLRELVKQTKDGAGFLNHAGHVVTLGGLLTDSPLNNWEKSQNKKVGGVREQETDIDKYSAQLSKQRERNDLLKFSTTISSYQAEKNLGHTRQADQIAIGMLKNYGPDMMKAYAPEAYRSLVTRSGEEGNVGRSGLQRLRDNNLASIQTFPEYSDNPATRAKQGLDFLTDKWPANTKYGDDVDAFRNAALKAIDTHPDLNKFADVGRVINKNMTVLRDQFQAASEGTAYEGMVQDCKLRAKEMSEALKNIKGEDVIACKQEVDKLRNSLDFIKDHQAKQEVFKKIQAAEELLKLADPSSPDRKALDKMLGDVLSRDFNAASAANWLKENALVIGASVIAGAITVASMGTASPLAVILVSSAVAVGAAQATKEVLFLVNHHIGDTGLGVYNERSYAGAWASKTYDRTGAFFSSIDNRSTQQNIEEFAKLLGTSEKEFLNDVLAPLGKEYGMNVLMGLGCIGLGQLGAQGLKGLSPSSFSKFLVSRQSMQFAQTMEQVTAEASRSSVSKEFLKDWMGALKTELRQNAKDAILDETRSAAVDEALGKYVGKGNSWVSFGISGAIALRNGRRSRSALEFGDNGSVKVARDFENEYIGQLKRDGHTVRDLGHGQYDVLPYNALKGEAPVRVLAAARGDGQPPRDLTHDGNPMFRRNVGELPAEISLGDVNWKQGQYGKSAMHSVGLMTDHLVKGNYEDVVKAAKDTSKAINVTETPVTFDLDAFRKGSTGSFDSFLKNMSAQGHAPDGNSMSIPKPVIKVNGIEVDMVTGRSTAGNSIKDPARIAAAEQEVAKFKNSVNGQRIMAERALIAIEEGIHVRQTQGGEIISSSYAQFIAETKSGADANAAMDPSKRSKESLEQEVLFALHDKGWTLDQIKYHYGPHHQEARAAAFKWLENHERSSNIAKNQKALDYVNNQSSKVEAALTNPALKEQSYKSLDHLSNLLKDGRISQDMAMDIVDLMKDSAKTGRVVSPHAIDALASLPKIPGAELIEFTKPQQTVLVDMLNSRALSKADLTNLLQKTEGTQLRTALDLMKVQHQSGTKNNRSIEQALELATNKSSASETITKLFHDKDISAEAYDALAKTISGKPTGNAEIDRVLTPERLKAAMESGAKLTFNSQLNDLGSVLSDYLAAEPNSLKRSPEQIGKLLDMPPGSSFQTNALLRSNLSDSQLSAIFADVQSLNSVTDRHSKLSQHNALLQKPELHSAICEIPDRNLRNDLIGAGANSFLKKEQIASIESAFKSSPEAAAALRQVFALSAGQNPIELINQIADAKLNPSEYNQLKSSIETAALNHDNLRILLSTLESKRRVSNDHIADQTPVDRPLREGHKLEVSEGKGPASRATADQIRVEEAFKRLDSIDVFRFKDNSTTSQEKIMSFLRQADAATQNWKDHSHNFQKVDEWLIQKSNLDESFKIAGKHLHAECPPGMKLEEYAESLAKRGEGDPKLAHQYSELMKSRPPEMDIVLERSKQVQELSNRLCDAEGIPRWEIGVLNSTDRAGAEYLLGANKINLHPEDLLGANKELFPSLLHESVHRQQDVQIIRALSDGLNDAGVDASSPQFAKELQNLYEQHTGFALDEGFRKEVQEKYAGTKLTKDESDHAFALAKQAKDFLQANRVIELQQQEIVQAANRLGKNQNFNQFAAEMRANPDLAERLMGKDFATQLDKAEGLKSRGVITESEAAFKLIESMESKLDEHNKKAKSLYHATLHETEAYRASAIIDGLAEQIAEAKEMTIGKVVVLDNDKVTFVLDGIKHRAADVFRLDGANDGLPAAAIVEVSDRPQPSKPVGAIRATREAKTGVVTPLGRDEAGNVYVAQNGSWVFQSDLYAVPKSRIVEVESREGNTIKPYGRMHDHIKQADEKMKKVDFLDPNQIRSAMKEAPEITFSPRQLEEFNANNVRTTFNTNGGNTNCMDGVAALFRTLQSGEFRSAPEIAELRSGQKRLGPNTEVNAVDAEHGRQQQMEWFRKAAATQGGTADDFTAYDLKRGKNAAPDSDFAVIVTIRADDENLNEHVFYGHTDNGKDFTFFDPQSGVRWTPDSILSFDRSARFHPLRPVHSEYEFKRSK